VRIRLVMALALTVLVTPALAGILPPVPATPVALGLLLFREAAIGLFIGSVALIAFAALQTAGTFVAYLSSFASALVQDPVTDQQSSTITGFFTALGLVLIFVTDLHHLMLRAIVDSYACSRRGRRRRSMTSAPSSRIRSPRASGWERSSPRRSWSSVSSTMSASACSAG
jgi:flagellar biosynthetic protein FliR